MSNKLVRHIVDLANLPPLTQAQKAELESIATRPDKEIDTRDISELSEEFWKKAVRNPRFKMPRP